MNAPAPFTFLTSMGWTRDEHKKIRAHFPGAYPVRYFDIAARGLISDSVKAAVEGFLEERIMGGADKATLWATVDDARSRYARLIGAESDEIAITKNVSEGLNFFAASLTWSSDDSVVVCPQLEHPNNVFLWYNLRDRFGIEVREIQPNQGRLDVERMCAAMDETTQVVTMPAISFTPGFITDVATVAQAARAVGALSLIDAAQSIGALQTDVRTLGIDALVVATQKCILSLYGMGFLYVRRDVAEDMIPAAVGRYGIDLGDAHETALSDGPLRYQPGARRFDLSNHNYLGATATLAALKFLEELDVARVEAHVQGLALRLSKGLLALGLPVVGGEPGPDLAHIVAVGSTEGGHHYTVGDPGMNNLYEHLVANDVRFSIRRGTMRFSVGVYNDEDDVDAVLELSRGWESL